MPPNHLQTLIGTLTSAEKKVVTTALNLRKGDKKLYLKYFKLLANNEVCDSEFIQSKLKISATNLSVLKTRCTDVILEVLTKFNQKKGVVKELRDTISEIELLIDKGQFQLAYRRCDSAIKRSESTVNPFISAELQQLKIQTGLYSKKLGVQKFESASTVFNEAITDLTNNTLAQLGRISLSFNLSLAKTISSENLDSWLNNYNDQKIKRNWVFAFNLLSNISVYYYIQKEPEKRLEIVVDYLFEFGDDLELKLVYATQYICCLNTILKVATECKRDDLIALCIEELKELDVQNINSNCVKLTSTIIDVNIALATTYILKRKTEKAKLIIQWVIEEFEKIKSNIDPKTEISIKFSIAKVQFELADYTGALSSLNRIIREKWATEFLDNPSSFNHVSYESVIGFRILVLSVLKDPDIDYFVKNYQVHLENRGLLNSFQKLFISYCLHYNSFAKRNNILKILANQIATKEFSSQQFYPLELLIKAVSNCEMNSLQM